MLKLVWIEPRLTVQVFDQLATNHRAVVSIRDRGDCFGDAPPAVMFDEPSLGLAPALVQDVLKTIGDLNREGLTCILVEQNVAVSLKISNQAYVLENGRVAMSGSGAELLNNSGVREAYLGL